MKVAIKNILVVLSVLISMNASLFLAGNLAGAGQIPAVLREMPADAMVVIATKPLADINSRVDVFIHQIGIVPPETPIDLVQNLKTQLANQIGAPVTIDGSKGMGVAIMDMTNANQAYVAFIPVLDAQKVVDAIVNKVDAGGGIWNVPGKGSLKVAGQYLLIAGKAELLADIAQMPKGVKLTPAENQLFARSDIAAKIKLDTLTQMIRPMAMGALTSDPNMLKYPSLIKIATMAIDRVSELQSIALGAHLGKDGINLNINIQATPGSILAKALSNHPTINISSLANLPAKNALAAYAISCNPKPTIDMLSAILDTIAADETLAQKINPADIKELKDILTRMYTLFTSGSFALYQSGVPSVPGDPAMKFAYVGEFANLAKIMQLYTPMCSLITKISTQAGFPIILDYKKNVGQVNGLSYDDIIVDLSQLPLPAQTMQGIALSYGGNAAFTEQFCQLDDKRMALGFGSGTLKEAIDLAKNTPAGMDKLPEIAQAALNLPRQANLLVFVDINQYIKMMTKTFMAQSRVPGNEGMGMMVGMMSMMFSQVNGTLGTAIILEDGAIKTDTFIPTQLIQSVVQGFQAMRRPPAGVPMQSPPPTQ